MNNWLFVGFAGIYSINEMHGSRSKIPSKISLPYIYDVKFLALLGAPYTRGVHHVTIQNTPIHSSLSAAPQLNNSQKALGTLPEDGNVMPKHVGATIHNS